MRKIGLLGGSFNPAHLGHRRMSVHAARLLGLDEVWWLVSPGNPLKQPRGMAPLAARFASARRIARRLPIRVTVVEGELGTIYSADTVRAIGRRFPDCRFVWLMGADILPEFHRWRSWRALAATVPIAVAARPGYDGRAHAARAMGWLRGFVRRAADARDWTDWRLPALVFLSMPTDPTSATGLRAANPDWHRFVPINPEALRDGVTRRPLHSWRHFARDHSRSA